VLSSKVVTPVKTGVQCFCNSLKSLDSGFHRNDDSWAFLTFDEFVKYTVSLIPPDSLLEFVRVDPFFHPVEKGGPCVGPERDDPFPCFLYAACRACRGFLPDLHDPFEEVAAGSAFIFVDRHRLLRKDEYHAKRMGSRGDGDGISIAFSSIYL
jgi:hypothetical protein